MTNIKSLASAPMSGFRHISVVVEEWDNAKVILREPPASAWARWTKMLTATDKADSQDEAESADSGVDDDSIKEAEKQLRAEVVLFMSILLDEDGKQVFDDENEDELKVLLSAYGVVHTRLLNKAIALASLGIEPLVEAEKK